MTKSYILLCLCDQLEKGRMLKINECCGEFEISIPTFRRYVATLREFFWERYRIDLMYDASKKAYRLLKEI